MHDVNPFGIRSVRPGGAKETALRKAEMNISGIDHAEFYVGDARQAGFYFCTAYGSHACAQGGPDTGLADQRSLLLRQGATSPGLVPVPGPHPDGNGELLRTIDHLAICVPAGQLAATSRYYRDVFGFAQTFEEYIEVGGQGMDSAVVQSPSRGVTFTLIEPDPTRRPGQINDFLQWHAGAGVQHLAFGVNDIVEAVGALAERGVRFLGSPASYYESLPDRLGVDLPIEDLRRLGILADRDHWGHLFQIFTESVHVRRT